ncbi:MAG: acetyl-CoA carboxylase carboxyl transferase subunit alpha, partial [Treponema sp.]|nr:acetyl-CoA carboxylase carboxyl transferase subunit alpha [Treponema sp.]
MNTELIQEKLSELKKLLDESGLDVPEEFEAIETKVQASSKTELTWKQVELARHPDRPYSLDYINRIFDNFTELHGDRCFGDDSAVVGGLAFLNGQPVTV